MVSAGTAKRGPSPSLYFCSAGLIAVPADGADPALLRQQHGDRLALDQRRGRDHDRFRGGADQRAAAPERRVAAEFRPAFAATSLASARHCRLSLASSASSSADSAASCFELLRDRDLFEPAQRAQPHVEDRLDLHLGQVPARHHLGLRIVRLADDADDLVEIEIDDDEAAQHLDAPRDRGEPVPAAPLQAPRGDGRERPAAPPSGSSRAARRAGRSR